MKEFVLLFFLVSGSNGQLPKANTFFENFLEAEKELEDRGNSQYSGFQSKAASDSARWAAAVQRLNDDFAEQAKLAKTGIEKLVATKTEHDAKKFQKEQEFLDVLKEAILTLNNTDLFAQTMAKHKEKQDKMTDLWKQWWEAKQEKKQKDLEYYLYSLDTIHQKWTEWQTKWNDAVTNNWEKQKEKYAAAKKEFDELKTMAKNELIKRKAEKQARKDKLKRKLVDSKNEVETKKEELEALQQDFFAQMRVIAEKKQEVTSLIDQFLSEEASYFWENLLHDKKQEDLNKVAYQKAVWDTLTGHNLAEPVAKATMLDQITGASGWRTATWVLLSISIVISVALVGLIVYTIQQHKHYERLGDVAIAPNQGVFFDYSKTNNGAAGYASTSASAPVALY